LKMDEKECRSYGILRAGVWINYSPHAPKLYA
jgi:hypothetical protein